MTRGAEAQAHPSTVAVICSVNPRLGQLRKPFWTPAPKLGLLARVRPWPTIGKPGELQRFRRADRKVAVALSFRSVRVGCVGFVSSSTVACSVGPPYVSTYYHAQFLDLQTAGRCSVISRIPKAAEMMGWIPVASFVFQSTYLRAGALYEGRRRARGFATRELGEVPSGFMQRKFQSWED